MEKMFDVTMTVTLCLFILVLSTVVCMGGTGAPIEVFPQPKDGQVRHVITLSEKARAEEENIQVELIPGKFTETDGVNRFRVGLYLEPVTLKGWGYTYYQVSGKDLVLSTMMAVPEGTAAAVDEFVSGRSVMVRYNSRLPIVIYSPEGVDVRYRFWTGGDLLEVAKEE